MSIREEKDVKKNQDEEINKEIVKSVISRGIPVEKFFELGGGIIKLDPSPNSTHVNVFEMAGIDPKKVEENTKLINALINSMKRVQIHERDKSKDGTHVDWWIYEESDPQNYFKEVKENE